MAHQQSIRGQLTPVIRERGIRATSRQLGVHHSVIGRWLTGERCLTVDQLEQLVANLGFRLIIVRQSQAGEPGPCPHCLRAPAVGHPDR